MMQGLLYGTSAASILAGLASGGEDPGGEGHRYWRILTPGNNNDIGAINIEFRNAIGGNDLTNLPGAFASSGSSVNTLPSNAFNDVEGTATGGEGGIYWSTNVDQATPCWIGYDFGAQEAYDVKEVYFYPARALDRQPKDWRLEFSNDTKIWGNKRLPTTTDWVLGVAKTFDVSSAASPGAHKHWRINVISNYGDNTSLRIAELELYSEEGGTNHAIGGIATSSFGDSTASGGPKATTIDGDLNTFWRSDGAVNQVGPIDLAVELTDAQEINIVKIVVTDDNLEGAPKTFSIDYSDDGANWTTAFFVEDEPLTWVAGEAKTFTRPPLGADYRYWRLYYETNNGSTSYSTAGEVEFRAAVGGADLTEPFNEATVQESRVMASNPIVGSESPYHAFMNAGAVGRWGSSGGLHWVGYDFEKSVEVKEVLYQVRQGYREQYPYGITLQWSDDATDWTTVWEYEFAPRELWFERGTKVFHGANVIPTQPFGAYKYWRIHTLDTTDSWLTLVDISLSESAGDGTEQPSAAGSSSDGAPFASKINEGSLTGAFFSGNRWTVNDVGTLQDIDFVGFQFNEAKEINQVAFSNRDGYGGQGPAAVAIEYSSDGIHYEEAWRVEGITWSTLSERKVFNKP